MILDEEFEELFKIQQYNINIELTDKYQKMLDFEENPNQLLSKATMFKRKKVTVESLLNQLKENRKELLDK